MTKKPFAIADYINPGDVSNLDRPVESAKVIEIPIDDICCNEKNFYDTSNIDELVKSIELNGLLEPVIVKPDVCSPQFRNGTQFYRLISGHRRFLSFKKLQEDDPEKWTTIPAIVREPANEVFEELMLIEANRATRVLSSADTMRQAERYKELLVQLKEQGVEIPGRLRDVVAEAMQISASRLARLEVIRKNLIEEYMELYKTQTLNESCAYALAQLSTDRQKQLFEASGGKSIFEWKIHNANDAFENLAKMKCENGDDCTNHLKILKHWLAKPYDYMPCTDDGKKCCSSCTFVDHCSAACPSFAAKLKKKKEKEVAKAKAEASERETERLNRLAYINTLWVREGVARNAAKVKIDNIVKFLKSPYMAFKIEDYENGDGNDVFYSTDQIIGLDGYVKLAEAYHCSLDYLLCRTDEPQSVVAFMPGSGPVASAGTWYSFADEPPTEGSSFLLCNDLDFDYVVMHSGKLYEVNFGYEVSPETEIAKWLPCDNPCDSKAANEEPANE